MKIAVTGASGGLGNAVIKECARLYPEWQTFGLSRSDADLNWPEKVVSFIAEMKPDAVIHCGAMTAVDKCETEKELARAVNVYGTQAVAKGASIAGARMVYISTDYVFDGAKGAPYRESDTPSPLNVYGKTKLEGETITLENAGSLVIRTSWLYGRTGKSFPSKVLEMAKTRTSIRMVADQHGAPTYSADLAEAILKLLDSDASGLFHVTNSGDTTWLDFARAVLELKGIKGVELLPVSTQELDAPAKRPLDSRLDCSRFARTAGKPLRHWREALADCLKT